MSSVGELSVRPDALAAAASALEQVRSEIGSVDGHFGGAAGGASGCAPNAASAFEQMQSAWQAELARLVTVVDGVAGALKAAEQDYVSTDATIIPGSSGDGGGLGPLLLGTTP